MQITLLSADNYIADGAGGFENVTFPVIVHGDLYRFGDNNEYSIDTLAVVKDDELKRIGYTGPFIGHLNFASSEPMRQWRETGPFEYWNHLKSSREVGAL